MAIPEIVTADGEGTSTVTADERAKELVLRPTLFVGVGGTGHLILLYLKVIFLTLLGALPPGVLLRVFDTDNNNLSASVPGPGDRQPVTLERGSEFIYTGRVPVAGIVQNIENMPTIRERLPNITSLPAVSLLDGARQIRQLGLLALLWHIDTVKQALKDPLWKLAHRKNLGTLDGLRFDVSRGINVFQVGSLCGGTNSGQFLDIAYLIRSLLEQLGDLAEFSKIVGLGVLPDAFHNIDGPNLVPNTVAALHELDHGMLEGKFEAAYRNGDIVSTPRPPFNIYYLLSGVDEVSRTHISLNELCWMAAMGLYHLAISPVGEDHDSHFDNVSEVLTHHTEDGHGTFFASYGLAELSFPANDVATWCGYRHTRAVVEQGLLAAPDDQAVLDAVKATLQTQELTADSLSQALAVDDTGIPLAVDLRPPARIPNADAHVIPQMAMNYVQNYRRERVDGDYRIWVRESAAQRQAELLESLSTKLQTALDDPSRGVCFARALAEGISWRLANLSATLTARRQKLHAQRANLELQLDDALTDLMQAPNANWFVRGRAVQEALDRYFKDAQEFHQVQFELGVYEQAIAVVVAAQEYVDTWARNIEALENRLRAVEEQLERRLHDLNKELLTPDRVSGLTLIDQDYLDDLYQAHAPSVSATVDALTIGGGRALHQWVDWSRDTVRQVVVHAASQPFEPIRDLTVERAILARGDLMTPQQWVDTLAQQAKPAWNLNQVLLPGGGAAQLARVELLGVLNREQSIYADHAERLVSTSDPHRITAFTVTAGAPYTALRRYPEYRQVYEQVRGMRPLHVLPEFLAEGQSTKLSFALAHLFGFIIDRGVYYYYQPVDKLADRIKLARGKENALDALSASNGLVNEIMERVEARIEDIGYDQAQRELVEFYAAMGDEDDLTLELKRLVRDYADQLGQRRLI